MQGVARVVKKYFRVPADGMFRGEEVLDWPESIFRSSRRYRSPGLSRTDDKSGSMDLIDAAASKGCLPRISDDMRGLHEPRISQR